MSEAEAIILTLIGVGIIVVGIMIVQELQALQVAEVKRKEKTIVREDVVLPMADGIPRWAPWWQPYWSYVPVRPFLY